MTQRQSYGGSSISSISPPCWSFSTEARMNTALLLSLLPQHYPLSFLAYVLKKKSGLWRNPRVTFQFYILSSYYPYLKLSSAISALSTASQSFLLVIRWELKLTFSLFNLATDSNPMVHSRLQLSVLSLYKELLRAAVNLSDLMLFIHQFSLLFEKLFSRIYKCNKNQLFGLAPLFS